MRQELEMFDIDGNEVKPGDFVRILREWRWNRNLREGQILKVSRVWILDGEPRVVLTGKKNTAYSNYEYNASFGRKEIRKVNYDVKKRKVIEEE